MTDDNPTTEGVATAMDATTVQNQFYQMQQLMMEQMKTIQIQSELLQQQQQTPPPTIPSNIVRQVKVPQGNYNMSLAEFRTYKKDCIDYKRLTQNADNQMVLQMRLNMDNDLKRAIDTNYSAEWDSFTTEQALIAIGKMVNEISNPAVHRKEFDNMSQSADETVREFTTRLKACAIDCNFICPHNESHNLVDYHVINRIRSGIHDQRLQQELLQKADTLSDVASIANHCETYEAAKRDKEKLGKSDSIATIQCDDLSESEIVAAISQYKKAKMNNIKHIDETYKMNNIKHSDKCGQCGYEHRPRNCPAYGKTCSKCGRKNHFQQVCRSSKEQADKNISAVIISAIERVISSNASHKPDLPRLHVLAKYQQNEAQSIQVVPDTGAQVSVCTPDMIKQLNVKQEDLIKPTYLLKNASGSRLNLIGYCSINFHHNNEVVEEFVFVTEDVSNFYLSCKLCKELLLVPNDFPNSKVINLPDRVNTIQSESKLKLPNRPTKTPFPPTEDNLLKLENWLLDAFAASSLNVDHDEDDPLPLMGEKKYAGNKHRIHLTEDAQDNKHIIRTPIPVAYNWKEIVQRQLDKLTAMNVLRKVPPGEPDEWCAQMVVVSKKDGTPRITVDYQQLNKFSRRETHHTPTPYEAVSSIPTESYKTVLDAYHGYYQVPLDDESIPLTTFITEFGRYQFLRTPQGHISSNDGYTHRYDDIIIDVPRKKKIVDDVLLHDSSIDVAFFHTFDYLMLCAENGITINPKKFKFARKVVDFVGYEIGWEYYKPAEEMMSSIKNFPMPANPSISDIRSFFGLVNQLAPFLASSSTMAPFREALKPTKAIGKRVYWDTYLQTAFEKAKTEICKITSKGLTYYDTKKETAVVTDWSKEGIGFVVLQKHCKCRLDEIPFCCESGWKLAFCNSRHLTAAEKNYAPIEGEALAVTWALKKARMFLLGCKHFHVIVDHLPLVKIFGNKQLNDIDNPRLFSFKEKTLNYSFSIKYIKGPLNHANIFSRYPVNPPSEEDSIDSEIIEIACINKLTTLSNSDLSITVQHIKELGKSDAQYNLLVKKVRNNSFCKNRADEHPILKTFYNVKDRLSIVNEILMYGFEDQSQRIVIPRNLRKQIIQNLHSANQGLTSLLLRARKSVYWPGMDSDIETHCKSCTTCQEIAPSHVQEPLIPSEAPEYPFQKVVADLFEIDGHHYLAYADRLTGFPELAHFPTTTKSSVIIDSLREFFNRWGAAEEISLDGGPNLNSKELRNWLTSWSVCYRLSSAYYPQSNGRAEAAVKSLKRLLQNNTGRNGSINTDDVARALLQYRNTPLRDINLSPAELALGRPLRDGIPLQRIRYRVNPKWAVHLKQRELQMCKSNAQSKEKFDVHSKPLPELDTGKNVLCQNTRTNSWDRSGTIVSKLQHRQYLVKMDGSGRISLRNRRHLKLVYVEKPHTPIIQQRVQVEHQKIHNTKTEIESTQEIATPPATNQPHVEIPSAQPDNVLNLNNKQKLSTTSTRELSTRRKQKPIRFRDTLT